MPRPRFSIAWLMALSLIAAVDCGFFRWIWREADRPSPAVSRVLLMSVAVLPMLHVLAALTLPRLLGRPGPARRPFRMGFEAGGWAAALLTAAACLIAPKWFQQTLSRAADSILSWIDWLISDSDISRLPEGWLAFLELGLDLGLAFALCAAPQILVALLAGTVAWLRLHSRMNVTAEGTARPHGPASHAESLASAIG